MNELIKITAEYVIVIPALLAIWLFFRQPKAARLRYAGFIIVGGLAALALAKLASQLYVDPRPFVTDGVRPLIGHAVDNGFPSDHALLAFFLAFVLLRVSKQWGLIGFGLAIVIGTARVAAGVHHAKDIVGSLVCAGAGALIAYLILQFWFARRDGYGAHRQSEVSKSLPRKR